MGDGPVLVLHEGWGRTPDIDRVIERFSRLGIPAVAPDLFASQPAWRAATLATASLPFGAGVAFERADLAYREFQPSAVLGISLGAAIALRRDWPVPVIAAYGHVPRRVRAVGPILGIYGTADLLLRPSGRRLDAVENADVRWYEGAGHSFLATTAVTPFGRIAGPHPSAAEAWHVIADFLATAMKGRP